MATEAIFCGSKSFWPFENSQNVEARYDEASVRVGDIGASSHDHRQIRADITREVHYPPGR
jgi:hypothetical protein